MFMKRILLVEDETNVVNFIRKGLSEENFEVSVALNGKTGYEMATSNSYHLIVLDIMLPDLNGIELCKELRRNNISTPILFLTALSASDNIALGLNSGADDYLIKPFKFNELIARINAILRRVNGSRVDTGKNDQYYRLADLVVDDDAKTVKRGEETISLTATEYRLLLALIKNKGRVLSRMDLLEAVWGINFNASTNVVDVYINYLRKKLDASYEPKLINTVVGMGYVLKEP
jgi:DNA-binding response OmpR family regulator